MVLRLGTLPTTARGPCPPVSPSRPPASCLAPAVPYPEAVTTTVPELPTCGLGAAGKEMAQIESSV